MKIPFNKPYVTELEKKYVLKVLGSNKLSGDGPFTKKCSQFIEQKFKTKKALLTTSCTHALDMAAILLDLQEGDEVIVPSYTFVSTVNSFILRGAKPVFVDIREDTLNIDEKKIEEQITTRTKAIMVVHYAGVACEMDEIMSLANKYNLYVIEDAAQAVNAMYKNKYLGTIGDIGTYSFHETKNFMCGEGGAILINNPKFIERAEIIREKGTDRSKFFRGEVDKYTWVDIGSSFLPSEILAAVLLAQLENVEKITKLREDAWMYYNKLIRDLGLNSFIKVPKLSDKIKSNYHIFYIIFSTNSIRDHVISEMKKNNIGAVFHYVPLHTSPMGFRYGYTEGMLPLTEKLSACLLRLPMYADIKRVEQEKVINTLKSSLVEISNESWRLVDGL